MGACRGQGSMNQEPPGYCVECHKPLDGDEIICGPCQDECDGRWDHLREDG